LFTDTHCHLYFNAFDEDRAGVLDRAREAGVLHILAPGIDLPTSRQAVALAEATADVFPNDARTWDKDSVPALRELAGPAKVVAIGEIGLDYYRDRAPRGLQREVFRTQLDLAAELELPVVVHTRDGSTSEAVVDPAATREALEILGNWVSGLRERRSPLAGRPGVLHSFPGDESLARQGIELGFLIGITGPVTFKNAAALQHLVAALPLESLLIETDAPFLTPQPHRGQRNEPAYVRFVAEKIAQIQGRSLPATAEITTSNAERLFRWQGTHTPR
jgi:TatD DNase family protein